MLIQDIQAPRHPIPVVHKRCFFFLRELNCDSFPFSWISIFPSPSALYSRNDTHTHAVRERERDGEKNRQNISLIYIHKLWSDNQLFLFLNVEIHRKSYGRRFSSTFDILVAVSHTDRDAFCLCLIFLAEPMESSDGPRLDIWLWKWSRWWLAHLILSSYPHIMSSSSIDDVVENYAGSHLSHRCDKALALILSILRCSTSVSCHP